MTHHPVLEPSVVTAIEDYFQLLQAHASAEEMLTEVVTEDFRTGFVGGHMWDGPEGLAEFLSARSVFSTSRTNSCRSSRSGARTTVVSSRVRGCGSSSAAATREPRAARSTLATPSIPGCSSPTGDGRAGGWLHSWWTASPTSTARRNSCSRCQRPASRPDVDLDQPFLRALDQPSRRLPRRANQTTSSTWQAWDGDGVGALGQSAVGAGTGRGSLALLSPIRGGAGAGGQYLFGLCPQLIDPSGRRT
jgi:hypothetical protein